MPRKKKENNEVVSKDIKERNEPLNLPTAEEYERSAPIHKHNFEPKYKCPKCDGSMWFISKSAPKMLNAVYYQYQCDKCRCIEFHNY